MDEKVARGGRPPTGSPKWSKERQRWEARVRLPLTAAERAEGVDKRRLIRFSSCWACSSVISPDFTRAKIAMRTSKLSATCPASSA
jgi:hypothetical protein